MPRPAETTLGELLHQAEQSLSRAGIERPRREARLLMAHSTGIAIADQIGWPERVVDDPTSFSALVHRRAAREPLAYITGQRGFWDLDFEVGPEALIPRPETETLIEEALERRPDRDLRLRFCDLGVGTGCILLTLLRIYPHARGTGVDQSPAALDLAQRNAQKLGVADRTTLVLGDWATPLSGPFDVVLSNPPYVAACEIPTLEPELRDHEPVSALLAGEDGLDAYRTMTPDIARILTPGCLVLLEIGLGQRTAVEAILRQNGLEPMSVRHDLAGIERCLVAKKGECP